MDSYEFDNVKAEKDIAMRKYYYHSHNRSKFKWLFLEACAALFVLKQSTTWLPVAAHFSGQLLREAISVFRSHLFIFLLFNAILLAVCALSARFPKPSDTAAAGSGPDLHEEFVTISEFSRRIHAGDGSPAPVNTPRGAESAPPENVGSTTPARNRSDADVEPNVSACTDKEEGARALVVKSCYRRTQSARLEERRKAVVDRSQKEFRRSCTDVCKKLVSSDGEEEAAAVVSKMSNEEFNRTIEAFIAAQKWLQREEFKEERETEQYMALAVCQ
ncbi:tRNA-methyltransferase non-catalytic subunit trm6MTase subunit [Parasponia andersonii]|uniref:tRNA-methyltransferase non-catalytic subunit trm6MTase subunit n=1 Tax=Parasponia andersonii TaxID=3476 RepID=A0A2P5C1K4_PARAD|nr:tRNA-methyltransferase non-catalytic subunit trm6MTase subunit [Parasponia andersonii]